MHKYIYTTSNFMYILKISAIKRIKISVRNIRNTRMKNVLNCNITNIRKMSARLCKIFLNFCKMFLNQFVQTLDVENFMTIKFNFAKAHEL